MPNIEVNEDKVKKIIIIYKENDRISTRHQDDERISKKAFHDIGIGLISAGFAGAIGSGVTGHLGIQRVIWTVATLLILTIIGVLFIWAGSQS